MCPHTTIYVSSYCYICVLKLLYSQEGGAAEEEEGGREEGRGGVARARVGAVEEEEGGQGGGGGQNAHRAAEEKTFCVAEELYRRVIKIDPSNVEALCGCAQVLVEEHIYIFICNVISYIYM
jgi:hypothetical protein